MSEYFDEQSDLNQLNRLIDNDKTIKKIYSEDNQ